MNKNFSSTGEVQDYIACNREQEQKEHPLRCFFRECWLSIERIWEAPFEWCQNIKWFIQRGKRGYADCDFWNLDYYIASIMVPMLKQLKDSSMRGAPQRLLDKHGYSYELDDNKKAEALANEEYNKIFREMIWTFETCSKVCTSEVELYNKNILKEFLKENDIVMLTKEETKRIKQGFDYFRDHFFNLLD